MTSKFNFGGNPGESTTSSAQSSSGLFATTAKPTSLFFGNSTTAGTTAGNAQDGGGGLFGNMNSTSGAGTDGSATTPAAPGKLFGQSLSGPAGGLFSDAAAKPPTSQMFGNTISTTPAAGSSFANTGAASAGPAPPSTSSTSISAQSTGGGLFGLNASALGQGGAGGAGGLFGGTVANKSQSASILFPPSNTSSLASQGTPAKPVFASSTTPVGAPPPDTAKSAASNMLGGLDIGTATGDGKSPGVSASGCATRGLFSNSAFNSSAFQPPANALSQQAQGTSPANFSTSALFGAKAPQGSASGSSASLSADKPAESTAAGAVASTTSGSLFGQNAQAGSLFSSKSAATPSTSAGVSTAPTVNSFMGGSASAATAATSATTTSMSTSAAGSSSLFGTAANKAGANTAPSTGKPGLLFGQAAGAPTSSSAAATTTATTTATSGAAPDSTVKPATNASASPAAGANTTTGLAASTMGPPSQLPRLKNKTMDEIITRWATDLAKYQKDFKEQASKVSEWDRLLVDNGERIQKLFTSTYEAERASHEIERQLSTVESQQDELAEWLDRYEKEVDELSARQQLGATISMGGPDQERDRTYKLAEKLTDRLDEMGQELSKMIKETNDMSTTLLKGNKPDDPLSQIVRVLNGHLAKLQWIGTNTAALQAKVAAAQKASSKMGNGSGLENDAAESFYRSYMGRK